MLVKKPPVQLLLKMFVEDESLISFESTFHTFRADTAN